MNQIIPSVCALALLSSYACAQRVTCYVQKTCYKQVACCREEPYPQPLKTVHRCVDAYREPYRISYPRLCNLPEYATVITNTDRALAMRQAAIIRQREIVRFEKGILAASTPITQPSSTGTTIFGATEGAGVFDNGCAPIPAAYAGTPALPPLRPPTVCALPPVGESTRDVAPLATLVPGKPGCVYSPSGQNAGYIDIKGLAPGSLAKDPYTGRVFRVP